MAWDGDIGAEVAGHFERLSGVYWERQRSSDGRPSGWHYGTPGLGSHPDVAMRSWVEPSTVEKLPRKRRLTRRPMCAIGDCPATAMRQGAYCARHRNLARRWRADVNSRARRARCSWPGCKRPTRKRQGAKTCRGHAPYQRRANRRKNR